MLSPQHCLENSPEVLRVEEASKFLNTSKFSVYRAIKAGKIPAKRIPNIGLRILRSDLISLFAEK